MENVLPCRRKGSHSSAVKAVYQRDNNVPLSFLAVFVKAVLSRYLDGAFVRFRAAVAEEYLLVARALAKLFREVCLHFGVVVVRGVLYAVRLLANRLYPRFVAEAEAVYANARAEVDVLFAVFVYRRALRAFLQHQIVPAV